MSTSATREAPLRVLVLLAATLLLTLSLGLVAPAAQAHADLVQSWPAEGATDRPVRSVKLHFGEPLAAGLAQVAVTGPAGSVVASDPVVTGADVVVPLRPLTRPGTYRVAYRVVSVDGHAVVGTFEVTAPAASDTATAGPASDPRSSAAVRHEPRPSHREQPVPRVADAVDQAEVIAAVASGGEPSAAPPADGLDLAVAGGGAAALGLLLGLHLLLHRRDAEEETP